MRKIIHVDMDAFFASVEQRDFPQYRGKPIAVGGSAERGVVAAASYEARKFGVKSAMPSVIAKKLCPNLIFVYPRFDAYKAASEQIMEIFHRYTDLVEPLSLDEAFLDVTVNKLGIQSAVEIATRIKADIQNEIRLTASAGISINKFLAKSASDLHKPDGLSLIKPNQIDEFVAELSIDKFFGIGRVTSEKLKKIGIFKGADLQKLTRIELTRMFGKMGAYYFHICRGEDDRPVVIDHKRKSVGAENTFANDLTEVAEMQQEIDGLCAVVHKRLTKSNLKGKTVTLKMKYFDFTQQTRSKTIDAYTNLESDIKAITDELLLQNIPEFPIRLLGVSVSNLDNQLWKSVGNQLRFDFDVD